MVKKGYQIIRMIKLCIFALMYSFANAQNIIVNSNLDDPALNPLISPLTAGGVITLRSAIQYTNVIGGINTITFSIIGPAPFVIAVGTGTGVTGQALPTITTQLTINGYSQPHGSIATSTTNAFIPIVLNGSAVNTGVFQDGLTLGLGSDNSVIFGLVIQNFPHNGINIQNGTGQSIIGNYIGTNQAGTASAPNLGNGVYIGLNASSVSVGSSIGIIGNRNIISGQQSTTGASPVSGAGIFIQGHNNQIIGNYIGTNASGANPIPNRTGIYLFAAVPTVALNNSIQNNIIAFNNGTGVNEGSGVIVDGTDQNAILSNSIYNNINDGISLINNGNDNLPAPVLTSSIISGTTLIVNGNYTNPATPNASYIIQFFTNPDASLVTQGQTFVGQSTITTDVNGNANFSGLLFFSNATAGQFSSATATLLSATSVPLSTSPYSANLVIAQGQASGSIDTSITFDQFPGIKAQSVVIDSVGRVIVGGLDSTIVRYNTQGAIDLTYAAFPGIAVKAMVIDSNDNIIAVGTEGSVVRYNANGTINLVFAAFPGVLANAVIFDDAGNVIVGGLGSTIVRYSYFGTTAGNIITTFNAFPGTEVNGLALNSTGQIIACGLQGQVVSYNSDGTLDITYTTFPGIAANSVVVDSTDRAIVVGKTTMTITVLSSAGGVPVAISSSSTNIVRYNTDGTINLVFAPFPALNAQNVILDLNSNIIVCGIESSIVQYNPVTGDINFTFEPFPGISTTWMALTAANEIVAVGWEGEVVRYYD